MSTGLFQDEKEAAAAYDRALVRLRGLSAATNFALSDYMLEQMEHEVATEVSDTSKCPTI